MTAAVQSRVGIGKGDHVKKLSFSGRKHGQRSELHRSNRLYREELKKKRSTTH